MYIPEFKGAIFDLDGTLLDSIPVWSEADKIFLGEHGIEYDCALAEKMKSMHFVSAAQLFIDDYGIDMSLEAVMQRISDIVGEKYMNDVPMKRGVPRLIAELKKRNVKMCAATSNKLELAKGALKRLGIFDDLMFVLTCDEVGKGKEFPDIYNECAHRMELSPDKIMVFEDALHGAECAKKAGFMVTGVFDESAGDDFRKIAGFADYTADLGREENVFDEKDPFGNERRS